MRKKQSWRRYEVQEMEILAQRKKDRGPYVTVPHHNTAGIRSPWPPKSQGLTELCGQKQRKMAGYIPMSLKSDG